MTRRTALALVALCVAVAALVALGVVWLGRTTTHADTTGGAPTGTIAPPIGSPGPSTATPSGSATPAEPPATDAGDDDDHAGDPDVEQEKIWRPIVVNFGRNFPNTSGGATKWRNRLIGNPGQPYVTDAVAEQLATVDIDNVPTGHYDTYRVLTTQSGTYQYAAVIDYKEGWSLALYLVTDGTTWQISAYDRYEQ